MPLRPDDLARRDLAVDRTRSFPVLVRREKYVHSLIEDLEWDDPLVSEILNLIYTEVRYLRERISELEEKIDELEENIKDLEGWIEEKIFYECEW